MYTQITTGYTPNQQLHTAITKGLFRVLAYFETMAGMSAAAKVAMSHVEFAHPPALVGISAALGRHRQPLLASMFFILLVSLGSVWAVYTMQYYDDLGAAEQQHRQDRGSGIVRNANSQDSNGQIANGQIAKGQDASSQNVIRADGNGSIATAR